MKCECQKRFVPSTNMINYDESGYTVNNKASVTRSVDVFGIFRLRDDI